MLTCYKGAGSRIYIYDSENCLQYVWDRHIFNSAYITYLPDTFALLRTGKKLPVENLTTMRTST